MVEIFRRHNWLGFFEVLRGYDDDLAQEFPMALNHQATIIATTMVRGFSITITPEVISRITTLPQGMPWIKEDKVESTFTKKNFFSRDEEPIKDKNWIRRESLPYPWNEVSYHIFKYISCEGRLIIIYGYQFRLLPKLRFGEEITIDERLSVPCFLMQSIIDMSLKVQEGKHQQLAHHGLIKLILEDSLSHLRIPIQLSTFIDMGKEVVIEIQADT